MSKFIKSSFWSLSVNITIRILSFITYPILVAYYLKGDIAIFKSFQSVTILLLTIIPLGTDVLYISTPHKKRENRWGLVFWVSMFITFFLAILFLSNDTFLNFFLKSMINTRKRILLSLFPIIEFFKSVAIIKFTSMMQFKQISLSRFFNKFILNIIIISFAFINPGLEILLLAILFSEFLEMVLLLRYFKKDKYDFFPKISKATFQIDKKTCKYIFFSGGNKLINSLAIQFPVIFVVIVMGEKLAPEFKLPLYAVSVQASMVMVSFSKVLFPYLSNIQKSEKMADALINVEFVFTLIILPILLIISFFAQEIVGLLFNENWKHAIIAMRILPIAILANVMNNPFIHLAPIKLKPQINFFYSLCLLSFRLLAIYLGYYFFDFIGVVIFYCFVEVFIRFSRLFFIDCKLINLSPLKLIFSLRNNFFIAALSLICFLTLNYFTKSKIISMSFSIPIYIFFNYYYQKSRINYFLQKIKFALGN